MNGQDLSIYARVTMTLVRLAVQLQLPTEHAGVVHIIAVHN